MSNKVENSGNTNEESNCSTKNFTESDDYASSTDGSVDADDCSLSTEYIPREMYEDYDHIEKMILVDDKFKIKTDNILKFESCDLDFTTAEQLDNHTFQNKNKPDGVMFNVDFLNKSVKKEVLETVNYENYQTVETKQDIEQAPIQIENTLENFRIKKEFNEELIIKDEKPNINDIIFECDSCELNFTTAKQLDNHTILCKKKDKQNGVDYLNKNVKEEVLEIDNYENYLNVTQQEENIEQDPLKIEDTLEKFGIEKEISKEIMIEDEKSDTDESINNKKKSYLRKNQHRCNVCTEVYSNKHSLKLHKRKHTAEKLKCDVCKKSFSTGTVLKIHKRIHTGEKPYECDTCKKTFSNIGVLNLHKRIHTGENRYQCDVCKKCFRLKTNLTVHKLIHTGEKPHECDVCKKSFRLKSFLKQHKFSHSSEKPYECDTCKKTFSNKKDLDVHKFIHTGEKPHECDVCKKSFRLKYFLKQHKLIHTGEKPFTCELCDKAFRYKSHLNYHKRMHNAETPYKCDICGKSFRFKSHFPYHECTPGINNSV